MHRTDVVERWLAGFQSRNFLGQARLAGPDLLIRLPDSGSHLGAREHRGRFGTARLLARLLLHSRGSLRMEPHSIRAVDDATVEATTHNTARRGSRRLDIEMTIVYRVKQGRIQEIEERVGDLAAWHAFWD